MEIEAFVGRNHEIITLNELWNKKKANLVVCRGRRRIGKSRLIKEFAKTADCYFEFQGLAPRDGVGSREQLKNFSEQLSKNTGMPVLNLENWTQAFAVLDSKIKNTKTVVFLDELSWMAHHEPDFAGKLKIAWDTMFNNHNKLMMVLCGSVSSWIDKNILNNSDFLGRISLDLQLTDLPLADCMKFWGKHGDRVSFFEKTKYLGVSGGVPRYLEEIRPALTAEQNIHRLCFSKDGAMFDEFNKIFNDTFDRRAKIYRNIVRLLVEGKKSFIQICNKLKKEKNGVISKYLLDLETSGFIARDHVYSSKGKKTSLSQYRIKDNYIRFYLKYIEPASDKIKSGLYRELDLENLPAWESIMGYQFQNLILNNLPAVIDAIGINPANVISASPYFQSKTSKTLGGCQIDLLAHTKSGTFYICEMKFRKNITNSVITEVAEKIRVFKKPKTASVRPVLIYCGEIAESLKNSDYFAKIISVEDMVCDISNF
ncbi:MAG: hypothetical protein A2583_04995 [Bdellovibrionales bacterium RIFOXYD1_FULL_53_11]|nr:MAG: hypothetical protein A2583_04995 [Bdellovibrionales bacterium RIFOXYD1_FULL_53_11]